MKKIAVILSGCGVYDGSEIHEACAALLALHEAGAIAVACAPAGPQMLVVDHLRGQPAVGQERDVLVESARLVRGDIRPLAGLSARDFDGVLLPGGFGAAKNLCTFATDGAACRVHPEVETFLRDAHSLRKPIAAMCIAPVILARLFEAMGARHQACGPADVVVDEEARLVTTPAYMLAGNIGEVFASGGAAVKKLLMLCP